MMAMIVMIMNIMRQTFSALSDKLFPQLVRINQTFKTLGAQIENLP